MIVEGHAPLSVHTENHAYHQMDINFIERRPTDDGFSWVKREAGGRQIGRLE